MQVSRRGFLAGLGVLAVGFRLPPAHAAASSGALNAFVVVNADGRVQVAIPSVEMGQGILTALPQLVADELDVDFERVSVLHAPEKKAFRTKLPVGRDQFTGGSQSVSVWADDCREAGASARMMLMTAAANRWFVDVATLSTTPGTVVHPDGMTFSYGELVGEAARLKPIKAVPRKPGNIAGQSVPRKDLHGKVTGETVFGIDVRLPNMVRASVMACPVFGGTVGTVNDQEARAIPGVLDVLVFESFVAVVAETWWPANQALKVLDITWNEGEHAGFATADVESRLSKGLNAKKSTVGEKRGKAKRILASNAPLQATYSAPYLEHAPLEPLNCTVDLSEGRCRIWTGTQVQTRTVKAAVEITGLKWEDVELHTQLLGGGFGRRGNIDFAESALKIAMQVDRPVQVIWSREESMQHGFYRPAAMAKFQGRVKDGRVEALSVRLATDNILYRYLPGIMVNSIKAASTFPLEGLRKECPYEFDHYLADFSRVELPVPIGFWRSVGHSHNAFFLESFIDELAHAAGADPVAFRLAMLHDEPRFARVLKTVAEKAGWGKAPKGRFQGVAMMECYGSVCAEVVELSMVDGLPKVHKVTAVVDCGEVINPAIVEAQVMGAVVFGLSSSLGERLDFEAGRVTQSNFHDYPLLRMMQAPEVDVHTVRGPESTLGGIGEVGTPPVAPAVCNAIFAATQKRIRRLPILESFRGDPS